MARKSGPGKRNGGEVKKRKKKCSSSSSSTVSSSIMESKANKRVRKKKTGCVNNGKQQSTKVQKAKSVKSKNINSKSKARESKGKCKTVVSLVNPKKRKLIDEEIEIIDTRSCKRMASLNASAILASLSEKRVNFNQSRPSIAARSTESTRSTRSTVVKILETEISSSESRLQVSTTVPDLGSSQYPERRLSSKQSRLIESTRSTGSTRSTRSTVFKILETEISSSESRVEVSSPEPDLGSPQYPERRLSSKQSRSIESTRSTSASTRSTGSTVVKILETKISSSDSQHISPASTIGPQYSDKRNKQSRSLGSSKRSTGSNKSTGPTVVKIRETKISSSDSAHVNPPVVNMGTLQYPHDRRTMSKPCRSIESTISTGTTTMAKIFETEINSANSILQVPQIPNIGRPQYPPHYASAFSVPHHINHAASINYPTESYGFYQHSIGCGPIMQPIHDPYIRAYSLHKPIPYYASQMAHHPDQTYREFNPISNYHQPQHLSHSSLTLQLHTPPIAQHPPPPHLQPSHHQPTPPTILSQHHPIQQPLPQLPPPPPPQPHVSMSHHHLYPISRPTLQLHPHSSSHPSILHQPLSLPQQLPPQPPQSAPGTSRFETNSFSSKAISYEQPSYYILQYPNNDLSCSLRANNMYHNLSSTNDQITIHQSPHDSQHLSVNIAVNNPTTTLMARDTMATIATTAQTISSNHMNPTHLQTISTPSSSSFSSTNVSGGPSIAFLGSTSILPGRLAPNMFQALSSSSPLSAAHSSSVIVNSIINPELPQGISPVPGPAPVAVATPVSVENLTSLSTASPSNLPNEIASLSSTSFSISTQVDFSPIITNNNHSRSPSTFGSPLTVNHQQQSNVATISPFVTPRSSRFTSKSVSCSTNTDPEPNRRSNYQQQQNTNPQQSSSHSQSSITITPFNVNSSGNYTSVNNNSNTSASVTNSSNSNHTRDTNYNVISNGGNNNNSRQQAAISSTYNNFLRDASVNTSKNGKDSPTINMTRKNQRKQLQENSTNHNNNISIGKQRTLTNRSNKYLQSQLTSSSSPAPIQASTIATPSMSTIATNTSPISTLPSVVNNFLPTSGSSSSLSSGHQQLVPTTNNHVNSNNKKGISISNNNHLNDQLPSSTKKRPNKSNKTLIDSNLVHGESSASSPTSSSTSSSTTTTTTSVPTVDQTSGSRKSGKKRLFHGWSWRGNPSKKPVFIEPDEPPQLRDCYPAICHIQGDVIKVRDSVLLRGGPRKTDLHFVAKICALWEAPETSEMMMSLLWYYRPEHTEPGRKPHDQLDEIFASKHQDVNSVACIDDKCYVLTFNEYCRYRKRQKMDAENIGLSLTDTFVPSGKDYNRRSRLPMRKVFPDRVFFCRKVYDFRLGRTLKNPVPRLMNSLLINDNSAWRR
ncbi:mucin-5AC-like isoform X2 [Panonychus citri]|uniref:mucin-5AC-like isoform X2 n=1 Tax=Panonychus citri TaxID=50023 RepID=UPI0023079BBB|nr:mucin-5AC-like isoform X2 [Panonychus citri]